MEAVPVSSNDKEALASLLDKGYIDCSSEGVISVDRILKEYLGTVFEAERILDIRDSSDNQIIVYFDKDRAACVLRQGDSIEFINQSTLEWIDLSESELEIISSRLETFEPTDIFCCQMSGGGNCTEICKMEPDEDVSNIFSKILSKVIDCALDLMYEDIESRDKNYREIIGKMDELGLLSPCQFYCIISSCFLKDIEKIKNWEPETGKLYFSVNGELYYAVIHDDIEKICRDSDGKTIYGTFVRDSILKDNLKGVASEKTLCSAQIQIGHSKYDYHSGCSWHAEPETLIMSPGYRLILNDTDGLPNTFIFTVKELSDEQVVLSLDERLQHWLETEGVEDGGKVAFVSDDPMPVCSGNEYTIRKGYPLTLDFTAWNFSEEIVLTL